MMFSILLGLALAVFILAFLFLLVPMYSPLPRRYRRRWGDSGRCRVPYPSTRSGGSASTRYSTTTTTTTPDDVEAVIALADDMPTPDAHRFTYKITEPPKDVKYTLDHEPKSYVAGNAHGTASIKVVEHKHEPGYHTPSHDYGSSYSHSHSHSHDHGSSYSHDHSSHDYGSSHDSGGSWGGDD